MKLTKLIYVVHKLIFVSQFHITQVLKRKFAFSCLARTSLGTAHLDGVGKVTLGVPLTAGEDAREVALVTAGDDAREPNHPVVA